MASADGASNSFVHRLDDSRRTGFARESAALLWVGGLCPTACRAPLYLLSFGRGSGFRQVADVACRQVCRGSGAVFRASRVPGLFRSCCDLAGDCAGSFAHARHLAFGPRCAIPPGPVSGAAGQGRGGDFGWEPWRLVRKLHGRAGDRIRNYLKTPSPRERRNQPCRTACYGIVS